MENVKLIGLIALWLGILATIIMRRKNAQSEETRNGKPSLAILIAATAIMILATIKAFGPAPAAEFITAAFPWILMGLGVAFAAVFLLNGKK